MPLADRVKELRVKKSMNQKKLSDASDLTQATISRIESGKVTQLKSEALKRLANALGTTVDYLIGKTDKLSTSEKIDSDSDAKLLFRGYEKLDEEGKQQLLDFIRFLDKKQGKERK